MQKNNLKKLSILGLVLMATSAVTAAILSDSKEDEQLLYTLSYEGTNTAGGDTTESCAPTNNIFDDDVQCDKLTFSPGLGSGSGSTSLGVFEGSSNATTIM